MRIARDDNYPGPFQMFVGTYQVEDVGARDAGQVQVQKDNIRPGNGEPFDGHLAMQDNFCVVTRHVKNVAKQGYCIAIVINN
jgi:hypothetical protein